MPRPFLELTLEQFAEMLEQFPWRRRVTEVHVHHTFRPNHADFAARTPLQSIDGMFRFHTEERRFSDIAQHATIDPRGVIWTGRNWNAAPASATGFNGNATTGPFMVEMIGNFDRGQDRWEGAQRDAAIEVIARIQRRFGLPASTIRLHNEMSPKSCPGTVIKKAELIDAVQAAQDRLATPRAVGDSVGDGVRSDVRSGAFGGAASPDRAAIERLLRLFDVQPAGRAATTDETELPEEDMTLRQAEMSSGDRAAFAATRDADSRDLTPEDFALLRQHVINLRLGAFSSGGAFQTTAEDVVALFSEQLPRFLAERQRQRPDATLKLVFFAHGGLNDEIESLKNARNRIPFYLANRCYPIFFIWETGVKETLVDILGQIIGLGPGRGIGETLTNLTDPALEAAFRNVGFSMWSNMKLSAERAFLPRQGGTFLVEQLTSFWKQHNTELEIHAIGHSAGSIFHAQFLSALCQQPANPPIAIRSLHFLAPAITVQLFKDTLMDLVGGRIKSLTQFTMARDFELADAVGAYRKSLLYLVSRAFEDEPQTPILGLEESLRRDPDMVRFFGLLGHQKRAAEILFSVREDGPSHSTLSKKHGDFDNDRATMSGVIRRILGIDDDEPIVEFPETVSRTVLDATAARPIAPAAIPPLPAIPVTPADLVAAPAVVVRPGATRRAVCVGIDEYEPPNRLAGCVNDATDWAAALRGLGFDAALLLNGRATWQGMQDSLTDLVTSSRAGDVIVFQYAGHGTRVADVDGDEPSGRDSALCPVDFATGRFLIDDDVRRIFERLPDGVNLTCFFDCCHSGTITRLVAPTPAAPRGRDVRTRGFRVTPDMEAAHQRFRAGLRQAAPAPRALMAMKEVSFTACNDAQTAQEIDGHGQFTVRALAILGQGLGGMVNGDFHQRVVTAFGAGAAEQTPQLDCAPANRTRPLLAALGPGAAAAPASATLESIVTRLEEIDRRVSRLGV